MCALLATDAASPEDGWNVIGRRRECVIFVCYAPGRESICLLSCGKRYGGRIGMEREYRELTERERKSRDSIVVAYGVDYRVENVGWFHKTGAGCNGRHFSRVNKARGSKHLIILSITDSEIKE